MSDPTDVVRAYFAAIAGKDGAAIERLFAPDAELVTAAGTIRGATAIRAFYEGSAFRADDLDPRPGPLLVDGDTVAVEIELRMMGARTRVADFFAIADGHIRRLAVYLGPAAT